MSLLIKFLQSCAAKSGPRMKLVNAPAMRRAIIVMLAALFVAISVISVPAKESLAQSPASGMGDSGSSTYGDAQDRAAEERQNASPEQRENAERMSPNDEGPMSEAVEDGQEQMENASPEEEANADRADPNRDEPGTQEEAQDSATDQAKNATPEEQANANKVDGDSEGSGMMDGLALKFFNVVGTHIWDWSIGWLGQKIAQDIGDALLYLPDPSSDEQITGVYNDIEKVVYGLLVVSFLVMCLAMIARSANTGVNFAGLKIIPKIAAVVFVLGTLPFLFGYLSTLATDMTAALMPNDEQIDQAKLEMTKAVAANLVISNFLNLILAIVGVFVLFMLIVVALLKSIVFVLLFIIAPFPLGASLIPGFEKYAEMWAKAVLVTAFLPAIWAVELWIGAILIEMPDALFGEMVNMLGFLTNGMFTTIIAIAMFYLMYKSPFIALSWAIPSYQPSFGGSIFSFGKFAAAAAMSAGIKSAVGGFIGGAMGSKGSHSDPPSGGERPPADRLGGKTRESRRLTTTTSTDPEGNVSVSSREDRVVDISREREMDHDEVMDRFDRGQYGGPAGSPPPPQTQVFEGKRKRRNNGRDDGGFDREDDKRGDRWQDQDRKGGDE